MKFPCDKGDGRAGRAAGTEREVEEVAETETADGRGEAVELEPEDDEDGFRLCGIRDADCVCVDVDGLAGGVLIPTRPWTPLLLVRVDIWREPLRLRTLPEDAALLEWGVWEEAFLALVPLWLLFVLGREPPTWLVRLDPELTDEEDPEASL